MANKSISKFNVAVVQQSGKVGTVRYYQKGGETYVRTITCVKPTVNHFVHCDVMITERLGVQGHFICTNSLKKEKASRLHNSATSVYKILDVSPKPSSCYVFFFIFIVETRSFS